MNRNTPDENKRERTEPIESASPGEITNPEIQFIAENKDNPASPYACILTIFRVYGKSFGDDDLEILLDREPKTLLPVGGKATYQVTPAYHELAIRKDAQTAELHFDLFNRDELHIVFWTEDSAEEEWIKFAVSNPLTLVGKRDAVLPVIGKDDEPVEITDPFTLQQMQLDAQQRLLEISEEHLRLQEDQYGKMAKCPRCGSTSISGNKKGFRFGKAAAGAFLFGPWGLLAGTFGSERFVLTCMNCGHKFRP